MDKIMYACKIAVVIPCYKVTEHLHSVISKIGPEVHTIYIVDDHCPENSGSYIENTCKDKRITVLRHETNQGVGGAVITGYKAAIQDNMDIIVKIDGDDQMDGRQLPRLVMPILAGIADYTKGNRFYDLSTIHEMPFIRLFGNTVLSFMNKFSSGYWDIFDPTNGYTAIHANALKRLPLDKISKRYFFESDILFRLNTLRAIVMDIPMQAKYGNEKSNLRISKLIFEFLYKYHKNFWKRIFYNYYLRNMSIASIELPLGMIMIIFGIIFGSYKWISYSTVGIISSPGTVMLAALPIIIGLQFILSFLGHDSRATPTIPLHILMKDPELNIKN
jgi:dolichol-phosphate mannosyltransferase